MGAASAADGREGVTAAAPAAATAAAAAGRDQVTTTADYSRRARPVSPATGGGAFAARRSLQGQRRPRARGHRGAAVGMAASKARAAADGAGLPPAAVGRGASVAAGVLAGTAAATAAAVSAAAVVYACHNRPHHSHRCPRYRIHPVCVRGRLCGGTEQSVAYRVRVLGVLCDVVETCGLLPPPLVALLCYTPCAPIFLHPQRPLGVVGDLFLLRR